MSDQKTLIDIVSGRVVPAKPEEIEAVQPFARQLIEDYSYPASDIQTRPQWHVKSAPSDTEKKYPVDIAVFSGPVHTDDNLLMIVECKARSRKDGRAQLETYLTLSKAELGVWTNGDEKLFIRKIVVNGGVKFQEIPNIPMHGQRVQDIGMFKRADLRPTHNLKSVFKSIRNYLAVNAVGITRDETMAREIINLIFCKIYDEKYTKPDAMISFRAGIEETPASIAKRVKERFDSVKTRFDDVFETTDAIGLDDASLVYVVGELQQYCLTECKRDVVADAFETFIGVSLKGAQGQFFTPRNVTGLIKELVDIKRDDTIIDPACGSGGFLIEALRALWATVDREAEQYGWPDSERDADKQKLAIKNLRGIDKDEFLSKVAKAYMAIMGDGRGGVFCENSLMQPDEWSSKTRDEIPLGHFSVVMTNPPFGKSIKVESEDQLKNYDLGHVWKSDADSPLGYSEDHKKTQKGVPPQILFIERCVQLLKPGGRCGIVLPESMLCNPSHRYIVKWLESKAVIDAVISFHEDLFQPYTHAKAAVVLFRKKPVESEDGSIFMAIARWCGHDSRGREIPYDDVPAIIERYRRFKEGRELDFDHLGFSVDRSALIDSIYLPKLYNPEIANALERMSSTHNLVRLGDLVDDGVVEVSTGDEVGKLAYGSGSIPFVRTSDIANWQIKPDPKHGLSEDLYMQYKDKQNIEAEDILMVRDGTYLVGTCAMVSASEVKFVYQSHILRFKVKDKKQMNPYLLLALLSSPVVKAQISARRFTQDIIDTLGARWADLLLPVPKSANQVKTVINEVKESMSLREQALSASRKAISAIGAGLGGDSDDNSSFAVLNM